MSRRKTSLGRVSKNALQMKKLRKLETPAERSERLRKARERLTERRAAATDEELQAARRHTARLRRQRRQARACAEKYLRTRQKIQEILEPEGLTCKFVEEETGKGSKTKKHADVDPLMLPDTTKPMEDVQDALCIIEK